MSLANCRVVLVRPHYAGNIGATARVMGNMGLSKLVLVDPVADRLDPDAIRRATHGEAILRSATVVGALSAALADCHFALAASANVGGLFRKQTIGTPADLAPLLVAELRGGRNAALVFGPEPTGLTNAEITLCHRLIQVPTSDAHKSLNLAQAVAICLYETRKQWLAVPASPPEAEDAATLAEQEQLFTHLRQALEAIHFLYGEKADPLMHGIRHLLGKARLSVMETKLLHGLARQILWHAGRNSGAPADSDVGPDIPVWPKEKAGQTGMSVPTP